MFRIRPVYYFWESAPLKYYKFFIHFGAIIGIIQRLFLFYTLITSGNAHWLDLSYNVISTALLVFAWICLSDREWKGVLAIYCDSILAIIYSAVVLGIAWYYNADLSLSIRGIISNSIVLVTLYIYYGKRRPLFSPWEVAPEYSYPNNKPADRSNTMAESAPMQPTEPRVAQAAYSPVPDDAPVKRRRPSSSLIVAVVILSITTLLGGLYSLYLSAQKSSLESEIVSLRSELDSVKSTQSSLRGEISMLDLALSTSRSRVDELTELNEKYKNLVDDLSADIAFYYHNVGLIVDGSSYYHTVDCPVFWDAGSYWAHNVGYCEYIGYSPCPDCFPE